MNIVRNDVDSCNATLTLTIEKADYAEKVDKSLKDYRKKVQMPGFRPGNVPASLVKKMYGKAVLVEEVNKIISEELFKYLNENKVDILGEPISNETIQKPIDFDTDETFEFVFDLGLAPEMKISLTARDKFPYYKISVTDEMIDNHIKMHASRLGKYVAGEKTEEDSVIKGDMVEVSEGEEKLQVVDALITPKFIKDETLRKPFLDKKVGDKIVFNPLKTMGNEYEVASLLNINKDKVADYDRDFEYTLKEITNHELAEINQEFFDKVVGEGEVKNEEEFKVKIAEGIAKTYIADSDYKFALDAKASFLKKNAKAEFPEEFLKRWLKVSNEKMTDETIEKDFPAMLEYLKWDLIKREFVKKYEINIDESAVKEAARRDTILRFAQYGISTPQEDILNSYVDEALKQKGAAEQFYQQAVEQRVIETIKEKATITENEVTVEEFNKLFETK